MSAIYGILGLQDTDRVYLSTLGQSVVADAVRQLFEQHNADMAAAMAVFVDETTTDYKRRYKLPGGGRMQRLGRQSAPGAVRQYGAWDVAFPLEEFGDALAGDRVSFGYMSVQDLDRHLTTIFQRNINTVRHEILNALLGSAQGTFTDELWGSLSIEPLANGDTVTYPPVLGSETEATDNHYLESGYAAASIDDTNDPYVTIVDELEEHFGAPTAGSEIAVFVNNAQRAKTEDLTDFDATVDRFIQPGDQTDIPIGPSMPVPGRVLGRHNAGAWVVEWRWIPANYMVGIHLGAPKPLVKRIGPPDTGLGDGLQLVAENDRYPFSTGYYSHRFGFGAGNRLNGVVMELGTGGTYSVPSGYA